MEPLQVDGRPARAGFPAGDGKPSRIQRSTFDRPKRLPISLWKPAPWVASGHFRLPCIRIPKAGSVIHRCSIEKPIPVSERIFSVFLRPIPAEDWAGFPLSGANSRRGSCQLVFIAHSVPCVV